MPRNSRAATCRNKSTLASPHSAGNNRSDHSEKPSRRTTESSIQRKRIGLTCDIVERPEQVEIAAIEEVDRQKCLVVPDRIIDQVAHQTHEQAQGTNAQVARWSHAPDRCARRAGRTMATRIGPVSGAR